MTIIACIKYIRSELFQDTQQAQSKYSLNPYDLFMLEQLIKLKKTCNCRLIGVSMGPKDCQESTQRLIAMGLDDIYLVSDSCFAGADTYSTSYILHKALMHIGQADLYAFGEKSLDGETSQVPIGVSSHLNMSCYTGVEDIKIHDDETVYLNCIHKNQIDVIQTSYPLSVCFHGFTTKEHNISLLKLKQARKYIPQILDATTLNIDKINCGQKGSKTKVIQIVKIISNRKPKIITGSPSSKVDTLKNIILRGGV